MNYPHNWTSQSMQVFSYENENFEVDVFHSETFRYILMKLSKFFLIEY